MSLPSRSLLARLAMTILLVGLLVWSVGPEASRLPDALGRIDLASFAAAVAVSIVGTILLPALVTHWSIRTGVARLGWLELVRINFVVRFYSLFLPRGGAFAVRWHRYRQAGSSSALSLVLYEKIVMTLVYLLAAAITLGSERHALGEGATLLWSAVLVASVVLTLMLVPFVSASAHRRYQALSAMVEKRLPSFVAARLARFNESMTVQHGIGWRRLAQIMATSLVGYWLFVLSPYLIARGMHLDVTFSALAWMRSVIFVVTLVPVTVAGIGVREAGFVGFFGMYGIPAPEGLAFGLLLFSVQLSIGMIGLAIELYDRVRRVGGPSIARDE